MDITQGSPSIHTPWYRTTKMTDIALWALIFFIPLSSSLKSIALVSSVVAIVAYRCHAHQVSALLRQPWVRLIGFFLVWAGFACFISPASWAVKGYVFEKYSKLLWLPVLTLGFSVARTREWGLRIFLLAMFITALIAYGMNWGIIYTELPAGSVFRNHIITGHMMAFAAYLAGSFAVQRVRWRGLYTLLWLIFTYELLFVSQGRTGYVMYFILMTLLIIQEFKAWRRVLLLLGLLHFGMVTLQQSPMMAHRYQKAKRDIELMQVDRKRTPLGYRLQFQSFAYTLVKERPLFGHGTGSFTYYFEQRNPIPAWEKCAREPHNQYWLIAAEFGMAGLLLYVGLLVSLCVASLRLSKLKNIALALLIPFLVGSYTDSLLFYSGCGYFFLTMLALCLGEGLNADDTSQ